MSSNNKFSRIQNIKIFEARGPWNSKSGGELSVLYAMNRTEFELITEYSNDEFDNIFEKTNIDIRGIRLYRVTNIPKGSVGAKEYHLARTEIVSMISGSALWTCEDVYGNVVEYILDGSKSMIIPHGILHTYKALEDNTSIQVVCNTLFDPEVSGTHDSYSLEDFKIIQQKQDYTQ